MALSQLVEEDVQLSLLAASGNAGLAAAMLAERFGLDLQYAENVLEQGYGLLIPRLATSQAREALPLLAALGLRVAIQPVDAMPPDEYCDVSVRLAKAKYAPKLIATLQKMMGLEQLTVQSFGGPQGLVVPALSLARAEWLWSALRQLPGVFASLSEHQAAQYDLFAETELDQANFTAVKDYLRLLGCEAGGFGDAVACGLDLRSIERIMVRFPDLGLFAVNQAFQRYEVLVIGKGALSTQEFADLMTTRPVARALAPRQLMQSLPLKLDYWLTRMATSQFMADYDSIGIHTVARLVRAPNLAA
ncbi:MAG: hypothetical protein ABI832_00230 [bacterium]